MIINQYLFSNHKRVGLMLTLQDSKREKLLWEVEF
jgi:hypothetical protein